MDGTNNGMDQYKGLRCYTDGSKTCGGTGAGFCVAEHNSILKSRAFGLTPSATVFQAEAKAIELAAKELSTLLEQKTIVPSMENKVVLLCDSKSVIDALGRIDTKSHVIRETKAALSALSKHAEILWMQTT